MLIFVALLITVGASELPTKSDSAKQSIAEDTRILTGQELVDYVNKHQKFFKAEYSPEAEEFGRSRIMDSKYIDQIDGDVIEDVDSDEEIPERIMLGGIFSRSNERPSVRPVQWDNKGKTNAHLSDTDILACCGILCGFGCMGGITTLAWAYFVREGVCTGGRYRERGVCKPYPFYPCGVHKDQPFYGDCPKGIWKTPTCRRTCQFRYNKPYLEDKIYGKRAYILPTNETVIQREIMKNGPVIASFKVYKDFLYYKSGIYVHTNGTEQGGHAVKMLGWGVENNVKYWLLANSWNTDWGENGYFRILRGENHCTIEQGAVAGMIDFERSKKAMNV
ncbi:papain family cysteine protease [Oesophagostomum dentatum]|uniref:Papain family cysteine protease n=1 Tax=Oesophagostomum dentatum TaxID=61180 RepID=A0A0B1TQ45_OESDE|nr:papain family cysteine protease [Oesophagostomum dentatum]